MNDDDKKTHRFRSLTVTGLGTLVNGRGGLDFRNNPLTQSTNPLPSNVTDDFAKEIVYYKLSLNWTASGVPNCLYASVSGVKRYDNTVTQDDVQTFINNLIEQGGPPDFSVVPYNSLNDAPNIQVKYPCYVVVDMDVPPGLRFIDGEPAIYTQHDYRSANYYHYYCNLMQYDGDGNATAGHSSGNIENPCCLISFGVRHISPYPTWELDYFNYNLESGSDPSPTFHYIDPVIRNRGPH